MKTLHPERFFTSSVKLCVDIRSSSCCVFCFQKGRSSRPPFRTYAPTTGLTCLGLRRLGLCSCCFCLQYPDLGLCLTLGGLASVLRLLQLHLDLRIELVDFFLQLC